MTNKVFPYVKELLIDLESTQTDAINEIAKAVVDSFKNNGILLAYGAGHSVAGALELTHRAGGFIPSRNLKEPSAGMYESVEGPGTVFAKRCDIRENDILFIISNSGRNPLGIDIALEAKNKGAKIVAVTSLEMSKEFSSKHSSSKRLFEVADYVLDNKVVSGDASIEVEGYEYKVCGMSTITTSILLQAVTYEAARLLVEQGIEPEIYRSQNEDGGREYNEALEAKYDDRLSRM